MPEKTTLYRHPLVRDRKFISAELAYLVLDGRLTKSQHTSICAMVAKYLPAPVTVEQRMPKGTTYVTAGDHLIVINNRAKVLTSVR